MEGGPPGFLRDYSCPVVLWCSRCRLCLRLRGFYALRLHFPVVFGWHCRIILCESSTPVVRRRPVWPSSLSLAATWEIAVAFFSSAYLDVSVQRVPSSLAMDSPVGTIHLRMVSCLIRKSADQSLLAAPRSLSQLDASFIGA